MGSSIDRKTAYRFPSGRLVLALLALSIALWAAMVFGTLAHLSAAAEWVKFTRQAIRAWVAW